MLTRSHMTTSTVPMPKPPPGTEPHLAELWKSLIEHQPWVWADAQTVVILRAIIDFRRKVDEIDALLQGDGYTQAGSMGQMIAHPLLTHWEKMQTGMVKRLGELDKRITAIAPRDGQYIRPYKNLPSGASNDVPADAPPGTFSDADLLNPRFAIGHNPHAAPAPVAPRPGKPMPPSRIVTDAEVVEDPAPEQPRSSVIEFDDDDLLGPRSAA